MTGCLLPVNVNEICYFKELVAKLDVKKYLYFDNNR